VIGRQTKISSLLVALLYLGVPTTYGAPPDTRVETINSLRAIVDDRRENHTVRATVMRTGNPFFVQDRTGGMEVETSGVLGSLRIGDEVVVSGRSKQARYSPRMNADTVRVLAAGVPPPAVSVTATMLAAGFYDRMFVETEGVLLRRSRSSSQDLIILNGGDESFAVNLPITLKKSLSEDIQTGATIRIRGICLMSDNNEVLPVPFFIAPRSAEDIRVVSPPPFWNSVHVSELIGLIIIVGLSLTYVYLRIQRWRFETILTERTRLAHDLHDSLAQGFAGIAFQLQAVRNSLRAGGARLDSHIDMAVGMVSHCHEDARKSIAMLRPADLDGGSLLENLRQQAEVLTRGGNVEFSIASAGSAETLTRSLETTLLRIGHEAITNAIRHANPSRIELELQIKTETVTLKVWDNGMGFDMRARSGNGFGIRAMHARATSHGGTLHLDSVKQGGTTVAVTLPLRRRQTRLSRLFSQIGEDRL
jgi:two-component sensor histidine kinase